MTAATIIPISMPAVLRSVKQAHSWFFLLLLSMTCCKAQPRSDNNHLEGLWQIELHQNDIGSVRTVMTFETDNGTFEAYTRKKADKDILGGWTALLGRTFTKSFKDGCLLRIEKGSFSGRMDTLRIAGLLTSALGTYALEGYVIGNVLSAKIGDGRGNYVGNLKGMSRQTSLPMEDYPALFEKSISLTENKIYNKELMRTREWSSFVKNMREVAPRVQDDLEMVFAFFYYAGKLPVTHYALMKLEEQEADTDTYMQRVFLEEKTPETAYLNIVSFDGSAAEMDSFFSIVKSKNYKNLVVDLRNNPGGSVEAGMAFTTQLADTTFYGGIFLTQRYFNHHKALPTIADYVKFPHFTAANYDLIIKGIHEVEGLCLKVIPRETTYRGRLFILTGKKTASTCEPIVYGLKQRGLATIVGARTAGVMLNGETFELDGGFKMVIPTADYYAADGFRIDQKGVVPDIEVKQEDALKYVMDNLVR